MARIIENGTTYQMDYQSKPIYNVNIGKLPEYEFEERLPPIKQPVQYDIETMSKFKKDIYIPFNLLHRPKDVVQTNPHCPIEELKVEEKIFEDKLAVRKTRPRVIIEPQIVIDDIPVEKMYGKNGLAEWIYSSDWKDSSNFVFENSPLNDDKHLSCESTTSEKVRQVLLKKTEQHVKVDTTISPVEKRFVKYATDWNRQQKKEYVDNTVIFWKKNLDKGLCNLCDPQPQDKSVTDEEELQIKNCLKEDNLRLPYTILDPTYTGFRPKVPKGIDYKKKLFKVGDPYVTTLMYDQGVYRKDNITSF